MPKTRQKIDYEGQLSIFELIHKLTEPEESTEAQYKIIDQLRAAIRNAIKQSPLTRHQIAGQMSHFLGRTITKEQIDSWTRDSDERHGRPGRHIPAEYLPAFCRVTGSNGPIAVMGRTVGLFVLPGPEALRAEIQRLDEEIKQVQARRRKRLLFLKEMEGDGRKERRRHGIP